MQQPKDDFPEALAEARTLAELSGRQLSGAIGQPPNTIHFFERGRRPRPAVMLALVYELVRRGVDVERLLRAYLEPRPRKR